MIDDHRGVVSTQRNVHDLVDVLRGSRDEHPEPWNVLQHRVRRVLMLDAAATPKPGLDVEDDRSRDFAAGHIADVRRLVDHRGEAVVHERRRGNGDERSHARHRSTDRQPGDLRHHWYW